MAFCEKCGAELSDGAEFCPKCGNKVNNAIINNNQSMSSQSNQVPERIQTAQELTKMCNYFSQKADLYDEYDRLTDTINKTKKMKGGEIVCLVLGILFALVGIFNVFLIVKGAAWSPEIGNTPFKILATVNFIAAALFIGIFILSVVLRKNKYNKSCDRYIEVVDELTNYYNNYGYCMVGGEYTNPKVLYQISDLVRQGRADTPKEAINIMIDTAHKNRMEMFAQQTVANTAAAARGARASAVFCAANFFLK